MQNILKLDKGSLVTFMPNSPKIVFTFSHLFPQQLTTTARRRRGVMKWRRPFTISVKN